MNSQDNFDNEQEIDINPNNMDNNNYTSNNGINNEENNEGEPGKIQATDFIKKSRNPLVALVTVTLKLLSILSFLFTSIFTSNEALVMTTVILFIAADFWYTKNISGRILVGLTLLFPSSLFPLFISLLDMLLLLSKLFGLISIC